jgi:hypothetical protein
MIKYFKELLTTLKNIEQSLNKIAACVRQSHRSYGDSSSISIKYWND